MLRSWVPITPLGRRKQPLPSKLLVAQLVLVAAAAALAHRTTLLRAAKLGIPPLYHLATWCDPSAALPCMSPANV
jgi:hypothetical protein